MRGADSFPETRWSRIHPRAGGGAQSEALESLARRYWRPIHAWLRSALGRSDDEAADLAQDFFVWTIESGFLAKADPSRGRFRAFLKTALRHYVADADRRRETRKRGGDRRFVPLPSEADGEGGFDLPDPAALAPDEVLDAAWRAEVVREALARTRRELEEQGRAVVFALFRDYFLDPQDDVDYGSLAARHGVTAVDVSNHLMRAKRLYREHLRALVLDTVRSAEDLDGELAWLVERGRG